MLPLLKKFIPYDGFYPSERMVTLGQQFSSSYGAHVTSSGPDTLQEHVGFRAFMPTIRESDGLAMSSRNVQLNEEQRQAAPVLHKALYQMYLLWSQGERDGSVLRKAAEMILDSEHTIDQIDYVSVVNLSTLEELEDVEGRALVSAAVRMGCVRLVDNIILE